MVEHERQGYSLRLVLIVFVVSLSRKKKSSHGNALFLSLLSDADGGNINNETFLEIVNSNA